MLETLRIKNLALVSDLTLELEPGLNVITGETGAGKSVIIGALNLVLGQRADRTSIRAGEESCSVEASFLLPKPRFPLAAFLEEHGLEPCEENRLVIRRQFNTSGTNRQFINGSATTLSVLGSLGEWLVDMHGPHDHQSLFHPTRQLALLDAFGHLDSLREEHGVPVRKLSELRQSMAELVIDERTYVQQMDLLRHQVEEIRQARLKEDEEVPLQEELQRATNASRLVELSRSALDLLSESEESLISQAGRLGRWLQDLQRLDPQAASLAELHAQSIGFWQELQTELSHYLDRLDLDPQRLAAMEERHTLLQSLKRKYGSSIAEILQFGEEAAAKLAKLEGREAEVERLKGEIRKTEQEIWTSAQALSQKRQKIAPRLAREVVKQLEELGFKQSQFAAELRQQDATSTQASPRLTGIDDLEFQFAPNPGEPSRPLRSIASSGEMARVMLALKTVLAAEDQVPVLVFDEVDANVGGETAQVVGQKMAKIARQRQVLCITHLAPVAASASAHYLVSKQLREGRTWSAISRLDQESRVTELARMLGGQTLEARKHAQALLR